MSKSSLAVGIFSEASETMLRFFRGWEQDLPHAGEKGGLRERRVADFLSTYLPKRYGVGTGHIIDHKGNISKQTDIVIYDAIDGVHFPVDKYYSLFPCECVYATIEVKSTLTASQSPNEKNRGTVYDIMKSTTTIKSLHRLDDLPPIITSVFAYSVQWQQNSIDQTLLAFYDFGQRHKLMMPESVIVLDEPTFVLCWYDRERQKDRFSHLYQKNTLMMYISDLITRLKQRSITVPNLWDIYGDWLETDIMVRIIPHEFYPSIKD